MFFSVLRFLLNGWVQQLYVDPTFYFSYQGLEWIQPLGSTGMHLIFITMALASLGICLGAFYRFTAPLFFLTFTYVELLDKTNYLNHYYFVSLIAFLLLLVPAHRYRSLDARWRPSIKRTHVPFWVVGLFRLQLGMVYCFAGIAKLNADWLVRAMPLKIWLPAQSHLPVIGGLLKLKWVAYAFSWGGAVYDLMVPFALAWKKTRMLAYLAVVGFHLITWYLFPIGMFPFIMILSTLIYFPASVHVELPRKIWERVFRKRSKIQEEKIVWQGGKMEKMLRSLLVVYIIIQMVVPFRYVLYPGSLFWTEQGYRFSWRVMLMEKAGTAFFYVRHPETGRELEVDNRDFLTPNQEKMMSTQPDMILQYAYHLADVYADIGIPDPLVRAEIYVTLNGSGSRPFIDPQVDLAKTPFSWSHKDWVLPFEKD